MYNCPATSITAANATVNMALANWGSSFIFCRLRESFDTDLIMGTL
jgi:hypothetical protein